MSCLVIKCITRQQICTNPLFTRITFHLAAQLLTCFIEFSTQKRLISCLIENVLHAGSLHNCAWSWKSNMLPMFTDVRVSYNSNRTVVKIVYFTLKYTISHCRMQTRWLYCVECPQYSTRQRSASNIHRSGMQIKQAQIRSAKSSVILTFHTNRSLF